MMYTVEKKYHPFYPFFHSKSLIWSVKFFKISMCVSTFIIVCICVDMCRYVQGRGSQGREKGLVGVGLKKYCIKWVAWPEKGRDREKVFQRETRPKKGWPKFSGSLWPRIKLWSRYLELFVCPFIEGFDS